MLSMGSNYSSNAFYMPSSMGQMAMPGMNSSANMGSTMQMAGQMLMQSSNLYNSAMNLLGSAQSPTAYPTPFYAPPITAMPVVTYMPVICQIPVMCTIPAPSTPSPVMMPGMPMMPGTSVPHQPASSPFMPHPPIIQHPPIPTPTATQPEPAPAAEQYQMLSYLLPLLLELLQQLSTAPADKVITPVEQQPVLPPPPPPPAPVYQGGDEGRYWGDPHLEGFDGEKYDVMGQSGKIYNMLSDKNVQYNTTFVQWGRGDATVISQAGIQVSDEKIFFDRSGAAPTINGQAMTIGETSILADGSSASWDGKKLTVKTLEYTIDLEVKDLNNPNGAYLDSHVSINEAGPFADFVAPHGLLGQTADGVAGKKDTGIDQGKQGGRVIDGTVTDYEVADLWSTSTKFNRFGASIGQIIQNEESKLVETVLDVDGNLLFKAPSLSVAA